MPNQQAQQLWEYANKTYGDKAGDYLAREDTYNWMKANKVSMRDVYESSKLPPLPKYPELESRFQEHKNWIAKGQGNVDALEGVIKQAGKQIPMSDLPYYLKFRGFPDYARKVVNLEVTKRGLQPGGYDPSFTGFLKSPKNLTGDEVRAVNKVTSEKLNTDLKNNVVGIYDFAQQVSAFTPAAIAEQFVRDNAKLLADKTLTPAQKQQKALEILKQTTIGKQQEARKFLVENVKGLGEGVVGLADLQKWADQPFTQMNMVLMLAGGVHGAVKGGKGIVSRVKGTPARISFEQSRSAILDAARKQQTAKLMAEANKAPEMLIGVNQNASPLLPPIRDALPAPTASGQPYLPTRPQQQALPPINKTAIPAPKMLPAPGQPITPTHIIDGRPVVLLNDGSFRLIDNKGAVGNPVNVIIKRTRTKNGVTTKQVSKSSGQPILTIAPEDIANTNAISPSLSPEITKPTSPSPTTPIAEPVSPVETPVPAVAATEAKSPAMMTRDEVSSLPDNAYLVAKKTQQGGGKYELWYRGTRNKVEITNGELYDNPKQAKLDYKLKTHEQAVKEAHAKGEPVHPDNLASYGLEQSSRPVTAVPNSGTTVPEMGTPVEMPKPPSMGTVERRNAIVERLNKKVGGQLNVGFDPTVIVDIGELMANEMYRLGKNTVDYLPDYKTILDEVAKLLKVMPDERTLQESYRLASTWYQNRNKDLGLRGKVSTPGATLPTQNTTLSPGAFGAYGPEGIRITDMAREVQPNAIERVASYVNDLKDAQGNVTRLGLDSIKAHLQSASKTLGKRNSVINKEFAELIEKDKIDPTRASANPDIQTALKAHDALTEDLRQSIIDFRNEIGIETPADWGINETGYLPHYFEGRFKVVDIKSGKTLTAGMDYQTALLEAKDFALKGQPVNVEGLRPKSGDPVLRVSRKQKARITGRIADAIGEEWSVAAETIQGTIGEAAKKQKFFGNIQERTGVKGYSLDYPKVMKSYIGKMVRWQELTKFIRESTPEIEALKSEGLHPNLVAELEKYQKTILGQPDEAIKLAAQTFRNAGLKNVTEAGVIKFLQNVKGVNAVRMLESAPAYLGQMIQPFEWLGTHMGEQRTSQAFAFAYKSLTSRKGRAWFKEHGFIDAPTKAQESFSPEKWTNLSPFGQLSHMNQRIGYYAGYKYFMDEIAKTPTQKRLPAEIIEKNARSYAREIQRVTEGNSTPADMPSLLRTNTGGALGMFQGFRVKSMESAARILGSSPEIVGKTNKAKSVGTLTAVRLLQGGVKSGGLLTKGIATYYLYQQLKREFKDMGIDKDTSDKMASTAMFGVLGYVGVDMSGSFTSLDVPQGNTFEILGRTIAGANLSTAYDDTTALMDLFKRKDNLPLQKYPLVKSTRFLRNAAVAYEGGPKNVAGKRTTPKLKDEEVILKALGFRNTKESKASLKKYNK